MIKAKALSEDWYVVFTGSKLRHWLMRWLNPDFRHCYMVKEDDGLWVIVNSSNAYTSIRVELIDDYPHIRLLCPNSVILPVRTKIDPNIYQWHLGINSCVDVCKGVLGIRRVWIWTPYQLYRYLNG